MKVRIEQMNPTVGNIDGNSELIRNALESAESDGIDLLILSEMVLTGYPVQDLLEKEAFREYCYKANEQIITETGSTAILFGTITPNVSGIGRKMFNSAILAENGKKLGQVNKSLLPTYDVFDELRYFEPNHTITCLEFRGVKLGVTICEDIWYNENEVRYHNYDVNPADKLKEQGARAIINISASPFTKTKHENRLRMLRGHASTLGLPVFYCNQTGANTDLVFDGDSLVLNSNADVISLVEPFQPGFTDLEWDPDTGNLEKLDGVEPVFLDKNTRIFRAIRLGLRDYLSKTGISEKIVLGLSGGIDSALVAVLAVESAGSENVVALNMPGEYSSRGSVDHSRELAEKLGFKLYDVSIRNLFDNYLHTLDPLFQGTGFGVAEENIQSRIRGSLLMAYSNKFGYMVLSTGNKSEMSVGYATLYGDMNGGLNLIGDLYKTEVYELSRWLNRVYYGDEIIPREILNKPPSAELRPGQKDSDSLPDYEILDKILLRYVDLQQELKEIVDAGFEESTVIETIRMVDRNEFKRFQAPPILKLSSKSFGYGRRWPIVQGWTGHEFKKY